MKQHFDMEIKLCDNECPMFYLVQVFIDQTVVCYDIQ